MSKVNLKKLWKIASQSNQPLLGLSTDLATLDFMEEYLESYQAFDRDIARQKGFFWPTWNLDDEETESAVFQQWQKDVYYFLLKNKENYKRLFALLSVDYDPLTNYDKHSYITETDDGQDQTTDALGARHSEDDYASKQNTDSYGAVSTSDSIGARSDSTVYGAKSSSDSYGAQSSTDTIGAVSTSDVHGAKSESDVHGAKSATDNYGAVSKTDITGAKISSTEDKIAGFNSATYANSNKSETNDGQQQDTHTEATRSDSHSEDTYTDGHTEASYTDSHTEDTRTNGHSEVAHTDEHTEATYTDTDNIGAQSNSHTEQARSDTHTEGAHLDKHDERAVTDTHTVAYGKEHSYDEHTTGNIGVTTSQQMAQSEVDLWNSFKFYDIMFNDIIKNLCNYYDEGYDCF